MKEYKYKINGNIYKVAVGDIDDNIAQVEVNGVPYKVELERSKAAAVKSVAPACPMSVMGYAGDFAVQRNGLFLTAFSCRAD